jgi:peptidoglycan/xylan/chitin deacetylase (PgdA/CDA1 family)
VAEPEASPSYVSPSLAIPRPLFRRQLERLARRYRILGLEEIGRLIAGEGEEEWPSASLALTFDDGYADNVELALPELQAVGVPASVFVTTGPLRGGDPLWTAELALLLRKSRRREVESGGEIHSLADAEASWKTRRRLTRDWAVLPPREVAGRIRDLASALEVEYGQARGVIMDVVAARRWEEAGMTVGGHTVNHPNLAYQEEPVLREELEGSLRDLRESLARPVAAMAYPNCGALPRHHAPEVSLAAERAGFRLAVTSNSGFVRPGAEPLALPRIGVTRRLWSAELLETEIERVRLRVARDAR